MRGMLLKAGTGDENQERGTGNGDPELGNEFSAVTNGTITRTIEMNVYRFEVQVTDERVDC